MYNVELIVNGELNFSGNFSVDNIENIKDYMQDLYGEKVDLYGTLGEYLEQNDIYTESLNEKYNIFIQVMNKDTENEYLCIELTDRLGNSENIGIFTNITLETSIQDIKKEFLNGLYDGEGVMIDKRTFPSFWPEGRFTGRSEDEIRFKFGDLVELNSGDTVRLVYVLASPRGKEWYIRKTEEHGGPYYGDISDDTYITIDGPSYMGCHDHIDALALFKPHFNIGPKVMRKFEKIWEGYLEDRRECYGDDPLPCQI